VVSFGLVEGTIFSVCPEAKREKFKKIKKKMPMAFEDGLSIFVCIKIGLVFVDYSSVNISKANNQLTIRKGKRIKPKRATRIYCSDLYQNYGKDIWSNQKAF